jgi:hypothetical protein
VRFLETQKIVGKKKRLKYFSLHGVLAGIDAPNEYF